jgi:hypothetical protein
LLGSNVAHGHAGKQDISDSCGISVDRPKAEFDEVKSLGHAEFTYHNPIGLMGMALILSATFA